MKAKKSFQKAAKTPYSHMNNLLWEEYFVNILLESFAGAEFPVDGRKHS